MDNLISRKKHIDEDLKELIFLCHAENDIEKVKNQVQTILNNTSKLLDNVAYFMFEKYVRPAYLHDSNLEKFENRVYFPYAESLYHLNSKLRKVRMNNLPPAVFSIIEKYQPYNPGEEWNKHMHELSNLGHRDIVPCKREDFVNIGGGFRISTKANGVMKDVGFFGPNGANVIKDFSIKDGQISGFQPEIMRYEIGYLVDGYEPEVEVIGLCVHSLQKIDDIIRELRATV